MQAVCSETPDEEARPLTPRERLINDMVGILHEGEEKITTADLLNRLGARNSAWGKHPSMQSAAQELASILTPLGVEPTKVWMNDRSVRGYWAQALIDAVPGAFHPTTLPADSTDTEDSEDPNLLPL